MIKSVYSRQLRFQKHEDPYRTESKLPEFSVCTRCGLVFLEGRWTSKNHIHGPARYKTLCSACRRAEEHIPAGNVEIRGSFFETHEKEIMNRILNIENDEKKHHPLERIMAMNKHDGAMSLTTTGIQIARKIGEGLRKSFKGKLSLAYSPGEEHLRVNWSR